MDHGWNLDIGELAYSPSARDLSDAKVHHMLSEELWKPYRRVNLDKRRRMQHRKHLEQIFFCATSEFPTTQLFTSRRQ